MARKELLRCVVCDITNDTYVSGDHPTLTTTEDAAGYLSNLKFWPQQNGDLVCDKCRTQINQTLTEMENEDEDVSSW
jgi:hypothetical protein